MITTNFEALSDEEKTLLTEAEKATGQAYNPYSSKMRVGAAVLTSSGKTFTGANVASASSSVNLCAERVVLAEASEQNERNIKILALIAIDDDGIVEEPVVPCGICRQFMEEFASTSGGDIPIICSNTKKDKIFKTSLKELLPFPYSGSGVK